MVFSHFPLGAIIGLYQNTLPQHFRAFRVQKLQVTVLCSQNAVGVWFPTPQIIHNKKAKLQSSQICFDFYKMLSISRLLLKHGNLIKIKLAYFDEIVFPAEIGVGKSDYS